MGCRPACLTPVTPGAPRAASYLAPGAGHAERQLVQQLSGSPWWLTCKGVCLPCGRPGFNSFF